MNELTGWNKFAAEARRERGHVQVDDDPCPAEVLSAEELARARRLSKVLNVSAQFGIECLADAAIVLDRLEFVKCLIEAGRIGKGDRN